MKVLFIVLTFMLFQNINAQMKDLLQEGEKAFNKGDYERSINIYSQAIEIDKKNYQAYFMRAQSLLMIQKYEQALSDASQCVKLKPKVADAYNLRGLCYGYIDKVDEAILDFNKAIKLDKNFMEAYLNRGSAYISKLEYDKSLIDLNKAISLKSDNPEIYFQRAIVYKRQKKYQESINDFTTAIKLGLKHSKVYYNRGNVYFLNKQYKEAIADYNVVLAEDSSDSEALNNRAIAYDMLGDEENAERDRNLLNTLSGNQFPPVDSIKFKKYFDERHEISLELPESWNEALLLNGDVSDLTVAKEKIDSVDSPYLVGVRASLNKNMRKIVQINNDEDLINFWRGSTLQNTEEYHTYNIIQSKTMRKGKYYGYIYTTVLQIKEEYLPLKIYEVVLVYDDTLFWAYFQAPEIQFGYYKKIFDKAIQSLWIAQ